MDNIEDDARYPPNPYGVSHQQGYGSSSHRKFPVRNIPYSTSSENQYVNDDDDEDDVEDEEDLDGEEKNHDQTNGVRYVGKNMDDDEDDDEEEELDDEDCDKPKGYNEKNNGVDLERHPKKRKFKSMMSSYEFAPRVPAPSVAAPLPSVPKPSHGGRNSLTDWTERETFVLLDAWGDCFLQRGRKSLRSEEWQEVADKVSEVSSIERTDTQCRNRLDTLKKKYKKEKAMLAETGATTSKWVYFRKLYMLMSTPPQQGGLSCGLESGEAVFTPRPYSSRANGMDKMRDSPANSESGDSDEDISDGLPPKKRRFGRQSDEGSSFRLLADSIHKFSDIYEKIENSKRQQMLELEKMRMDFHREMEMQKRQIMESTQAEIAKIQQGDEEDNSTENASG
ncbi:trihelix transcription factor ASIL2-like [Hibiscus syriacus]|uniref:trihelix transcription factor ASIL2-like n=1 Tax=Hibiscus syriacus TaxID=106335 RepID=UPI0019206343|nr:trihelix transcription factor ASIL2-like [Hibiscus syriacus]